MALIDKASLLMVPSVYEDGTLYNVLPSGNKAPDETGNHNGYDQTRADFTFSRGFNLSATRIGPNGLIEKGRENLMLYSGDLTNALWYKYDMGVTGGQTSYNGSNTAFKLTPNTTNSYHRIIQSQSWSYDVRTASFYAKADGYNIIRIVTFTGATDISLAVDLSDGSIVQESGATKIAANVESVGNEWYRISLTASGSTTTSIFSFQIYIYDDPALPSAWSGDGTSGVLFADPQRELGLVATDYIETGATTATAGVLENTPRIDYSSGAGALLLEPQRTNLFETSEYFGTSDWSKDNITLTTNDSKSPEGVNNASLIYPNSTSSGATYIYNTTTGSSSKYTISAYVKADGLNVCWLYISSSSTFGIIYYDLSDKSIQVVAGSASTPTGKITDMGNGWHRIVFTMGSAASIASGSGLGICDAKGSFSVTKNGEDGVLVYGLQLEAASHVSSYVPTYGSAATRGADSCIKTGISNLIGQTEGVVYLEVETIHNNSDTGAEVWFMEIRKDQNNSFGISSGGADSAPAVRFVTKIAGVVSTDAEPAGFSNSKIAIKYTASEFKIFQNGSLKATISKSIGGYVDIEFMEGAGSRLTMPLKQFIVFDEVLTDAECQTLTA